MKNAVGIDVSKGKSVVAIMRPYGEVVYSPFELNHTASDISSLIELIKSIDGESRIVMEHTGRYYEVLANQLSNANLFVSAVNPKLIKDFDNESLRKVKSDKADSVKIARYALDKWNLLQQYSDMDELRNQLKTMNRQFNFYMKHKTAMKNNLIGILDQTYPGVNTYFDSPARSDGSQKWVDFASTYWHVDCVRKMSLNAFVDHYQKWSSVSTNNLKNETDLRLQLYNSPANTNFIAFCYIIESNILSVASVNPSRFNTSHVNVYLCTVRQQKNHVWVSIHPMLMFICSCLPSCSIVVMFQYIPC